MRSRHRTGGGAYIGEYRQRPHTEAPCENEITLPAEAASSQGRTYCIMAPPREPVVRSAQMREEHIPAPSRCRAEHRSSAEEPRRPDKDSMTVGKLARLTAALLFTAVVVTSPLWLTGDELLPVMRRLSAASASVSLPQVQTASAADVNEEVVEPTTTQTTTTTTSATTTTAAAEQPEDIEGLKPVSEKFLGNSGTKVGCIYVKNSTGYEPDFKSIMNKQADCRIKLNAGYQVLIVHTHTTEGYAQRDDGFYSPDYSPRTTDSSKSVVAVGEVLAQQLEQAGIRTLHAKEVHDHPQYNGSYDRAKATISKYLEEYPSIEMVLDVHRDAITYDDGTKLKPTAEINGRKAAQVMIISGCDAGGKLYFPGWKSNLCMALQIQQSAQSRWEGLMRPLSFAPYRYNMHMTPNSLLLEFGTDANTLEEALYSAELLGGAIADVLLEYDVNK